MNNKEDVLIYRPHENNKETKEWNVDGHKVELITDKESYTVLVDHDEIKTMTRKMVEFIGLEVSFKCDNNKYYLVKFKGEYRIVKNNRFIETNRRYYSKTIDYSLGLLCILLMASLYFVRIWKLFGDHYFIYVFIVGLLLMAIPRGYLYLKYYEKE